MSSSIYIFDETLEPLVSKSVKGLPNVNELGDLFRYHVRQSQNPIIDVYNWRFVYIKRDTLYFVAVVDAADDAIANYLAILTYLEQLYQLFRDYVGVKVLDRNLVLDNTLLVMELIDETLDYGIVQLTEPSIMKDYIRVRVNLPEQRIMLEEIWNTDSDSDSDGNSKRKHKHKSKGIKINLPWGKSHYPKRN